LQVSQDELAVAFLRRQRVSDPGAIRGDLRALDRFPRVVDVVRYDFFLRRSGLSPRRGDRDAQQEDDNERGADGESRAHTPSRQARSIARLTSCSVADERRALDARNAGLSSDRFRPVSDWRQWL